MDNYEFHNSLKALWEKSVTLYEAGNRDSVTYFDEDEKQFLSAIGHTCREVYDFAEDKVNYGEPDFETFLLIASLRRHYFLNQMKGHPADVVVDTADLPAKTDSVRGIEWLPRLIPKARAKLRGEMSDDLMYDCGGDRKFFKLHNLHPAEFLAFVMDNFEDDDAIIDFVAARSEAVSSS
jgi:hypothetical protein